MESAIHFRPATEEDIPALLWLIQVSINPHSSTCMCMNKHMQLLAEELRDPRPNGPRIGKKGLIDTRFTTFCVTTYIAVELLRDGFGEHRYFNVLLAELDSLPQDLQPNHLPQDLPPHPLPQDLPPHPLPQDPPSPAPDVPLPSASMEKDEKLVGYALYFITYNSLDGRIMFLEDLYVRPEYRSELVHAMTTHVHHVHHVCHNNQIPNSPYSNATPIICYIDITPIIIPHPIPHPSHP